jgi:Na+/H+ antiporter NhaD/arsenite permease-like protein
MPAMDAPTLLVFAFVYLAMFLGRVPGLSLDRTGAAVLGAIALLAADRLTPEEAWLAVDVPTITLLFGMMVVSAQLRLGGFYAAVSARMAEASLSPPAMLALLIAVAGGLAAVLANDVIALAMTPVLLEGCLRRGLRPLPFLLALACAANVGSAATLIGNPQNILIGQTLGMHFGRYMLDAAIPAVLGLFAVWAVIAFQFRGRWHQPPRHIHTDHPSFNAWQTAKGLTLTVALMVLFLATDWPRDVMALAAVGLLLLSRRMHSRHMLGLVDWQLILLFIGLFVVNHVLAATGTLEAVIRPLRDAGMDPAQPMTLFVVTAVLSNIVSNVPAVMLLLPSATHPQAGLVLALSSTLAGNLLIVGSIANIIVVGIAASMGCRITWREHARVGLPVTMLTLAIAAAWLAFRAAGAH